MGLFAVVLWPAIAYGLAHFINQTIFALPRIAEATIPVIIDWAEKNKIELPFTDYQSLKAWPLKRRKTRPCTSVTSPISPRAPPRNLFSSSLARSWPPVCSSTGGLISNGSGMC